MLANSSGLSGCNLGLWGCIWGCSESTMDLPGTVQDSWASWGNMMGSQGSNSAMLESNLATLDCSLGMLGYSWAMLGYSLVKLVSNLAT